MRVTRFIAVGDSFTEGMCDEIVDGKYRGWADRIADVMAHQSTEFTYSNFAVRGKLIQQVAAEQVPIALTYVTGSRTLFSFHAGANDVLRPNYKPEVSLPLYAQTVRKVAESGATVLLFTVLERTDRQGKTADLWAKRFSEFNKNVRAVAKEVGAIVADANEEGLLSDRRFLADDRLHLNPLGHDRIAQGILEILELPYEVNWRQPLPPAEKLSQARRYKSNVKWFLTFFLPWIWRRLRGRSSGDGMSGKHSLPISWPSKGIA